MVVGETIKGRENSKLGAPFILLCVYIFWDFVRPADIFPVLKYLRMSLLLSLILVFTILSKAMKDGFFANRVSRRVLMFIGFAMISVLWAEHTGYWLTCFKGISLIILIEFVGIAVLADTAKRLKVIINFLIAVHVFIALYGLLHLGTGPGNFLSDENDLALALVSILPLAFFMAQGANASKIRQWTYIGCCFIFFLGIAATNSRGGFVGFLVAMGVAFLFFKYKVKFLAIVALSGLLLLPLVSGKFVEEMQTISDTSESTADTRLWSWKLALDMFKDNPVAGVGMCNYRWKVGEYELAGIGGKWGEARSSLVGRVSHSIYFTVLPELGFIGFLLFYLTVVGYFFMLRDNRVGLAHEAVAEDSFGPLCNAGLAAGMAGFLAAGAFITVIYNYPQFWMLCGLGIALVRVTNANDGSKDRRTHFTR